MNYLKFNRNIIPNIINARIQYAILKPKISILSPHYFSDLEVENNSKVYNDLNTNIYYPIEFSNRGFFAFSKSQKFDIDYSLNNLCENVCVGFVFKNSQLKNSLFNSIDKTQYNNISINSSIEILNFETSNIYNKIYSKLKYKINNFITKISKRVTLWLFFGYSLGKYCEEVTCHE